MASSPTLKFRPVVVPAPWSLAEVAGRLVEISGSTASATLSIAFQLVREAQQRGEPAGWVTSAGSCFYPPDAVRSGADLAAL
ncbi:MAG TPA: hypothetical protein VE131_07695, partial [Terriglobales bacterium]|nr:hypothetical protein [Terriglobales bacterium]